MFTTAEAVALRELSQSLPHVVAALGGVSGHAYEAIETLRPLHERLCMRKQSQEVHACESDVRQEAGKGGWGILRSEVSVRVLQPLRLAHSLLHTRQSGCGGRRGRLAEQGG